MPVYMGRKYWAQKVQHMKAEYRLPPEQKKSSQTLTVLRDSTENYKLRVRLIFFKKFLTPEEKKKQAFWNIGQTIAVEQWKEFK